MRFTVNRKELQDTLAKMNPIISKRSYLPILQNVHVKVNNENVEITATNLEQGIKIVLTGSDTEAGESTIQFVNLFNITKALSNDTISFETGELGKMMVTSKKSKYNLATMDPDDFPRIEDEVAEVFLIDSEKFKDIINKVIFAASNDDSRFNLNSVYFSAYKEKSCVIATDGHRLAFSPIDLPNLGIIVPKSGCLFILKLLGKGSVDLYKDSKTLYIRNGNMLITTRLIEGDYPDFTRVIPDINVTSTIIVNNKELLSSIKRVSIMTSDRNKGATFTIKENEGQLYVKNPDNGDAQDGFNVNQNGEDFEIIVNTSYLSEALSHISTPDSRIEYFKEGSPIMFKPTDGGDYFSLVMPMRS